ncbi:hypothetical protein B296_00008291 [Ensete ventricosum]|uniref:Uncharacterized protein n=1 Tax=Ensete ventricosum TaxID=4639 RepID=A0A427AKN3_ENSVE|nr:hypothetical protein B296_00008291 [Ensete ventricosum]
MSSSSRGMSPRDVKAYRALEVMKSCHSFDSVVTEELLGLVWERYSITNDYELYVPQPEQRPFDPFVNGFELSTNALEVGFRFPLHPVVEACSNGGASRPSQMAPNSWRYMVAFLGECRGVGIVPTRTLLATWGLVQLHGVRIPSFLYVLYRFVVDCPFCDIEMVNLKALRGMPRMSIAHVVAHATASSTREEPTKAPKVHLPDGGDTRPKKKPKLGFWKMSKSTTAQEATTREACGAKECLGIDRLGMTDRELWVLRGRSRLERPEQRGSKVMVAVDQRATDLQSKVNQLKSDLREAKRQLGELQ